MGNTAAVASERRSVQGWSSSKTEDFSITTINSETFPCALGSNNNNLQFSVLQDYVTTTTKTKEETLLLKVITKDHHEQYSVVGISSSATAQARWSKSFSDSGWEISGSLDKVGSKALLTTGKTTSRSTPSSNGQENNKVLAVVLKRDKSTYLLLSKQPAYKGQRMHLRIERGTMLFPWATCTTIIDGGGGEKNNNYEGSSSAQQFRIKRFDDCGISYVVDVSSEIFGMRTVHIKDASTQKQYALARQQQQQQQQIASSTTTTTRKWDIVSGPLTSPGLVLCILAIVCSSINGNDVFGGTSTSSTTQHQHLVVDIDHEKTYHPSATEEEEECPVEEEEAETTTTTPESEDNHKEEEEASEIIRRKIDGSHDHDDDETNFNSDHLW